MEDFDAVLEDIVGGSGPWQWSKVFLMVPLFVTAGVPLLLHMFTAYTPKHRCKIDGCDDERGWG